MHLAHSMGELWSTSASPLPRAVSMIHFCLSSSFQPRIHNHPSSHACGTLLCLYPRGLHGLSSTCISGIIFWLFFFPLFSLYLLKAVVLLLSSYCELPCSCWLCSAPRAPPPWPCSASSSHQHQENFPRNERCASTWQSPVLWGLSVSQGLHRGWSADDPCSSRNIRVEEKRKIQTCLPWDSHC